MKQLIIFFMSFLYQCLFSQLDDYQSNNGTADFFKSIRKRVLHLKRIPFQTF